jgi:hypothetical protein
MILRLIPPAAIAAARAKHTRRIYSELLHRGAVNKRPPRSSNRKPDLIETIHALDRATKHSFPGPITRRQDYD